MKKSADFDGVFGSIKMPKHLLDMSIRYNAQQTKTLDLEKGEARIVKELIKFKKALFLNQECFLKDAICYSKEKGVCSNIVSGCSSQNGYKDFHMKCYLPYLCMDEKFVARLISLGLVEFNYNGDGFGNLIPLYLPKYKGEYVRLEDRCLPRDLKRVLSYVFSIYERVILDIRMGSSGRPVVDYWDLTDYGKEKVKNVYSKEYDRLPEEERYLLESMLDSYESYMGRMVKEIFLLLNIKINWRLEIIRHEDGEDSLIFY